MNTVIIILGPTASGKTKLSIELSKAINGEIISADSMQIYKYMNIGTAKPDKEEMQGIKHYLIDELNPDEEFSVAKFQEMAYKSIDEVLEKGKVPIVAGGTGLYINSLIYNINFTETVSDWSLRERLQKEAEEKGNQYLHDKLKEVDIEAASKLHVNDLKRIIRALEVYEYTKMPISHHQKVSRLEPPKYNFFIIGLKMDREKLYSRINDRVELMFEKGLIEEVKRLQGLGYNNNSVAMQGLGYKEILSYFRGEMTLNEAINLIKRDTRRFAKRQMTWFRRIEDIYWIDLDEFNITSEILKNILYRIETSGIIL